MRTGSGSMPAACTSAECKHQWMTLRPSPSMQLPIAACTAHRRWKRQQHSWLIFQSRHIAGRLGQLQTAA